MNNQKKQTSFLYTASLMMFFVLQSIIIVLLSPRDVSAGVGGDPCSLTSCLCPLSSSFPCQDDQDDQDDGDCEINPKTGNCWTCFPAGTGVEMEGGQSKNIEDVEVGEKVISQSESGEKSVSTVTKLDQPIRNHMCQINYTDGEILRLTDEHPLFTQDGWKSINPKNSYKDVPSLPVTSLQKGDKIIKSDGSEAEVDYFGCWSEKVQAYNLILDGGVNTYFADGYLAHNKGGGGTDPKGFLDVANCSVFAGWAGDKDNPNIPIDVHFYDGPNFIGGVTANGVREAAVCSALGTTQSPCLHGFWYTTPNSVKDGQPHIIDAWGINIPGTGGSNKKLTGSGKTVTCAPPTPTCSSAAPESATTTATRGSFYVYAYGVANATNVLFPTWTTAKDQDDLEWWPGTDLGGGTWRAEIDLSQHTEVGLINVHVYMNGNVWCSTANFTRTAPAAWWQVKDGDVVTNGSISSQVPASNVFIDDGAGEFPGVPIFANSLNTNSNSVSSTLWEANTSTTLKRLFDYAYFDNLVPSDVVFEDPSTTPLDSGGTAFHGYYWYKATSGLTINSDINLRGRKVILFVEGGDLNINGRINLNDGSGFFLGISDDNISVDPTVTGTPSLEGLYVTDGNFNTGLGASQLHIRGSVASFGSFTLQRDLGAGNTAPSELFEYAPDQILLFPAKLASRRTRWNEIAP